MKSSHKNSLALSAAFGVSLALASPAFAQSAEENPELCEGSGLFGKLLKSLLDCDTQSATNDEVPPAAIELTPYYFDPRMEFEGLECDEHYRSLLAANGIQVRCPGDESDSPFVPEGGWRFIQDREAGSFTIRECEGTALDLLLTYGKEPACGYRYVYPGDDDWGAETIAGKSANGNKGGKSGGNRNDDREDDWEDDSDSSDFADSGDSGWDDDEDNWGDWADGGDDDPVAATPSNRPAPPGATTASRRTDVPKVDVSVIRKSMDERRQANAAAAAEARANRNHRDLRKKGNSRDIDITDPPELQDEKRRKARSNTRK